MEGKNPNIKVWLELPISFSCKFLENLTELYNFFLGHCINGGDPTTLGFHNANSAFLKKYIYIPLQGFLLKNRNNLEFCLILNPFFFFFRFYFKHNEAKTANGRVARNNDENSLGF